jgi:hypothetical protein
MGKPFSCMGKPSTWKFVFLLVGQEITHEMVPKAMLNGQSSLIHAVGAIWVFPFTFFSKILHFSMPGSSFLHMQ